MNKIVSSEDIIEVIKNFLSYNEGDEATEDLILAIGAEMLGVSSDKLLEIMEVD